MQRNANHKGLSWFSMIITNGLHMTMMLELTTMVLKLFELDTIPFMEKDARLIGLDEYYRPTNTRFDCSGAWSCLLKTCQLYTDKTVKFVAMVPLNPKYTCDFAHEYASLFIGKEPSWLFPATAWLLIATAAAIFTQLGLGYRALQKRRMNSSVQQPLIAPKSDFAFLLYLASNFAVKGLLIVCTILASVLVALSDEPKVSIGFEIAGKVAFILGLVADSALNYYHAH